MEWIKVFSSDTEANKRILPDKPQLLIVNGKRICLVKHANQFFAVQDRCTHNSEPLSGGSVNFRGEIICPWHNYRFDLKSGKACDSNCSDLETFPTRLDEDGFFVGM